MRNVTTNKKIDMTCFLVIPKTKVVNEQNAKILKDIKIKTSQRLTGRMIGDKNKFKKMVMQFPLPMYFTPKGM